MASNDDGAENQGSNSESPQDKLLQQLVIQQDIARKINTLLAERVTEFDKKSNPLFHAVSISLANIQPLANAHAELVNFTIELAKSFNEQSKTNADLTARLERLEDNAGISTPKRWSPPC